MAQEGGQPLLDFSANINPLGPPGWLRSLINRDLHLVSHYPDPECATLINTISIKYQIDADLIVAANGSTELLHLLPDLLHRKRVIVPVPCYIDYLSVFEEGGFEVIPVMCESADQFSLPIDKISEQIKGNDAVIFGNPVNPTGAAVENAQILELAAQHRETMFIIDEAFHDFISPFQTVGGQAANIITLNSLTKFFAMPGLRVGFGIFPEPLCSTIKRTMPPWSVNVLAQRAAVEALQDDEYCRRTEAVCRELRAELQQSLGELGHLRVFDSTVNYLLVKLENRMSAEELYRMMLRDRLVIRRCGNYKGLDDRYFRVAVRRKEENERLVESLRRILSDDKKGGSQVKNGAKTIMFQGTSSNAGKSILSAALCRILLQDGFSVCPFKAQNMSLNSHVTADGGEMGRAQVVQAQAAKLEPDWRMNPILLKPNSDTGSQVIVNGRPVKNMDVRQYHAFKEEAWKSVTASFDQLRQEYDVVVLEGAGSPGEINLKRHDIVNMKMASYAKAPVLLVGDIDRGGVYASFAGIMDVLEEWERALIRGFIVNKFRGDISLLDDAHRFVKDHTGREVIGVVPYISDMSIPQEDSVSLRDGFYKDRGTRPDQVEIVVIDIPHISNFTDIDPLYHEQDVNIRFVSDRYLLGRPDAIILPGSKNVAGDLRYLKRKELDRAIVEYADKGGTVVGICGGYQMLGNLLLDPHQIETRDGSITGMGLLDIDTILAPEKTLVKREGIHVASGRKVIGYEIHHGRTRAGTRLRPVLAFDDGETCGNANHDSSVWGAYLHGIFDEDGFRRWFIDHLRVGKQLGPLGSGGTTYNVDKSLDELADLVRSSVDMQKIYQIMNLES